MTGKLKKGQYGNIRISPKTGEARASPASPLPTALCDEHGLTELHQCKFNYQLLNLLLDDLMPWHSKLGFYDFSLLEVT